MRSRNPKSGYLPTRNRSEPLALTRLAPRLPIAAYRSGLTETGTGLYDHPVPMVDELGDRGRDQPDPILMVFDFLRHSDLHAFVSCANGSCSVVTCAARRSLLRPFDDLGKRKAEWEREIEAPAVGK